MESTEPIVTYEQLLNKLLEIRDKDSNLLNQSIHIFDHESNEPDKPAFLKPSYAFGTVKELLYNEGESEPSIETRDLDFKHNPEQLILCIDYSPYDEDGDSVFTLNEDGTATGNKTGKIKDFI